MTVTEGIESLSMYRTMYEKGELSEPEYRVIRDRFAKLLKPDADEEKRYAFTATHFFEVAEPVVLKPHAVKAFDTSNGQKGLETAFHCARAVRGLPPVPFPPPK